MRVLQQGFHGSDVKQWQQFLRGQGLFTGIADSDFGPLTHQATVVFQTREGLTPDGRVGNATLARALQLGLPLLADSDLSKMAQTGLPSLISMLFRSLAGARCLARFPLRPNLNPAIPNTFVSWATGNSLISLGQLCRNWWAFPGHPVVVSFLFID